MNKAYYIFYPVDGKPEVIRKKLSYSKQKEYLNCYTTDSAILECGDDYTFRALVDDEGMLIKKKYNRCFYGDFLVLKTDLEGFEVEMTEEEVNRIIDKFDEMKIKHSNSTVNDFLDYLITKVDSTPKTFEFESPLRGVNIIGVSALDVIEDLRKNDTPQMESYLMDLAAYHTVGIIPLEKILEIIADFQRQLAEFRNEEINTRLKIN